MRFDHETGFTLMELMISLTITAVLLTIVFSGFRIGVRAWEGGEETVDSQQRYRVVLELMRRQLNSVCLPNPENSRQQKCFFKGDREAMEFLSYHSLVPGNESRLVHVFYRISKGENGHHRLEFSEKNFFPNNSNSTFRFQSEDDYYLLIDDADLLEFEYLRENPWASFQLQNGSGDLEKLSWITQIDEEQTRAVKIRFKPDEGSGLIEVLVPFKNRGGP
jgi:prepilin-type N-terminal cleavage/methylation domain-containing protein